MTRTLTEPVIFRIVERSEHIDENLPVWARRSNPVVRRHLGIYWKTLPLELSFWLKLLVFEVGLVLLTIPFPILYSVIMPVVTVSIVLLPAAYVLYGRVLYQVIVMSVQTVVEERENNTLSLLRVTPTPLHQHLLSKLAAALWRHLDNLGMVMAAHILLSLPIFIIQYTSVFPADDEPGRVALAIILGLFAGVARIFLEPAMLAALGMFLGSLGVARNLAIVTALGLALAYLAFINLPRLAVLSWETRVLLESVLPVLIPLGVMLVALRLARRALEAD